MTHTLQQTPDRSGGVSVATIGVWLLIQLTALILSAARVPLWYGAPQPVERIAVHQMLVAQLAGAALLMGWLMPNLATGLCVLVITAPLVAVSGMLSEVPFSRMALAWAHAVLWLAAMMFVSTAYKHTHGRLMVTALAGGMVVGVPVLRYLRLEFFHIPPPPETMRFLPDAIGFTLAQLTDDPTDAFQWIWPMAALLGGALMWQRSRRRTEATAYPQA